MRKGGQAESQEKKTHRQKGTDQPNLSWAGKDSYPSCSPTEALQEFMTASCSAHSLLSGIPKKHPYSGMLVLGLSFRIQGWVQPRPSEDSNPNK